MNRRSALTGLAGVGVGAAALGSCGCQAPPPGGVFGPFSGLGAWTSMYQWSPTITGTPLVRPSDVAALSARGVSTLYIQTSRQSGTASLLDPSTLRRFVDECHRRSISVVGWYLPALTNLDRDLTRLVAMRDVGVDAIGIDIETTNFDAAERSRRQVLLLERLRQRVGSGMGLGGIVYPPLQLKQTPSIWPNFPWRDVSRLCDVLLPMSYWTFRRARAPYWDHGYRYTVENFKLFAQLTGRNGSTIHSVGGMASDLKAGQAADMARAVAEYRGLGASLYEWSGTSSRTWTELAPLVRR